MAPAAIKTVLHGGGRMAEAIHAAAEPGDGIALTAVVAPAPPAWDSPLDYHAQLADLEGQAALPDLIIDFSLPAGTLEVAGWCARHGVALLSGVTGLGQRETEALQQAARKAPVLWSPNLSVGVNLLAGLCAQAARALDPSTRVHIEDIHHQWKQDAPSGTALMLGAAVTNARPSDAADITYSDVREGEHVGTHHVSFAWAGEKLVLSHEAQDRGIFARGARRAGRWLSGQPAGLYTAADWLGL